MKNLFVTILMLISASVVAQQTAQNQAYIIPLSAHSYDREIAKGIVLVDYWASWCAPCRRIEPILKSVSAEKSLKIGKIDVDEYKDFVLKQKISAVPTLILYKDGVEMNRMMGDYTKEQLLQFLKPYVN